MIGSKSINIWASRGFIQSLTEEQRSAFINLATSQKNVEAMIEQAQFENGNQPIAKTEILFAIRYAIRRQSASSSDVAEYVEENFDKFDENLRKEIINEIEQNIKNTASSTDYKIWDNVLKATRKSKK